ncbi:hypothetical protein QA601_07155 [Chitinispirillales bacterium ANBcel5]|uniref:hypothetical protein n=1 Tax=Cellulosispirillum alkaliphilum TaxID=3039283 RepID=UPI002A5373BD|nr:hypothetical protein [Chitinispirillales bacterium ANBcel5]
MSQGQKFIVTLLSLCVISFSSFATDTTGIYFVPDTSENVVQEEVEPQTTETEFSAAGFGPASMSNITSRDLAYSFFVARFWDVNPNAAIRVSADATTDFQNSLLASLNLGLNLFPFQDEIAPYAAAEFGFGYGRESNSNLFGFNTGAGIGVILFRSASIQMLIEGKVNLLFDSFENSFPTVYTARVGILY